MINGFLKNSLLSFLVKWAQELKSNLVLVYFIFKEAQTPWWLKGFCALTCAYALSPIDLIPDFIPVIGLLDDLLLLPLFIMGILKLTPTFIYHLCKPKADAFLATKNRITGALKWFGLALIGSLIALIVYWIFTLFGIHVLNDLEILSTMFQWRGF